MVEYLKLNEDIAGKVFVDSLKIDGYLRDTIVKAYDENPVVTKGLENLLLPVSDKNLSHVVVTSSFAVYRAFELQAESMGKQLPTVNPEVYDATVTKLLDISYKEERALQVIAENPNFIRMAEGFEEYYESRGVYNNGLIAQATMLIHELLKEQQLALDNAPN